jgi:hypothetical protein
MDLGQQGEVKTRSASGHVCNVERYNWTRLYVPTSEIKNCFKRCSVYNIKFVKYTYENESSK